MQEMLEQRFRKGVREHLALLSNELLTQLRQLIAFCYPDEVKSIDFEVFSDGFTRGFPVRAFFIDSDNSEHFVFVCGEATYPSPIDPGLLKIEHVYSDSFENLFLGEDERFDSWTISDEELIEWFANIWREAGGRKFYLEATIAPHDSARYFDLKDGEWKER